MVARLLLRRLKEGIAETHGACGRCVGKRVSNSPGFKDWRKNFEKLGFKDLERERFEANLDAVMYCHIVTCSYEWQCGVVLASELGMLGIHHG